MEIMQGGLLRPTMQHSGKTRRRLAMRTGRFFVDTEAAGYGLQGGLTIEQMGNSAPDVVDDKSGMISCTSRIG